LATPLQAKMTILATLGGKKAQKVVNSIFGGTPVGNHLSKPTLTFKTIQAISIDSQATQATLIK